HDEVPKLLQLLYLGDQRSLKSTPSIKDLERTEEKTYQIGEDIKTSLTKDYWPTQKSRLCDWCSFKSICPAFN
ncbi:MAG: exodeoxyribonuclease V subunit beta, partial [Candidatus Nanopelagicaceae bacterium]